MTDSYLGRFDVPSLEWNADDIRKALAKEKAGTGAKLKDYDRRELQEKLNRIEAELNRRAFAGR